MTEINLQSGTAGPPEPLPIGRDDVAVEHRRSYAGQVAHDVLVRLSAQAGLAWVAVLVVFAVFAPFIANSHPILMQADGRWSSPLLAHLSPADVILQVLFWATAALCVVPKLSRAARLWTWVGVLVVSLVVCRLRFTRRS